MPTETADDRAQTRSEERASRGLDRSAFEKIFVLAMLLLAGVGAWRIQTGPRLVVDASRLEAFPERIGIWGSAEVPLEPAIEEALGADLNLQRIYRAPTGDFVWLYIGYYGTEAGGRPAHTPRGCYPGAGWAIEESRVIDVRDGTGLRVNEYLIEREGDRRLVHFWYRSHRRSGILGGLDQNFDRLIGRLWTGRGDGALVRVSAPVVEGAPEAVRSRLLAFASQVDSQLGDYWPEESLDGDLNEVSKVVWDEEAGQGSSVPGF